MKSFEVPLTQGMTARVSSCDYKDVSQYPWFITYWKRTKSYVAVRKKNRKIVFMHREIMNPSEKEVIDHINHDTLDNRRENLRICSRKENARNRRLPLTNKSGFKGVFKFKSRLKRPFAARIKIDGIQTHLGYYVTAEEAARKYDEKAREAFGEFAFLNFGGVHV